MIPMLDRNLRDMPKEVDDELRADEPTRTLEVAVTLLDAIRACISGFRIIEADLEREVVDKSDDREFTVGGVGVVQIKRKSTRTKWDTEKLLPVIVARALDERRIDEETGEAEPQWEPVVRAFRECAGIGYWKVTALRPRGIDPEEFCETTKGDLGVWIQS